MKKSKRKGWYITNENDEVVYDNARTYGECSVRLNILAFMDENKAVKPKYKIRFGA